MKLNKLREEMAQSFIDALKEDRIPWEQGWQSLDHPRNAVSDYSYKGINNLWLSYIAGEKGYQDPRWCTFKQAQDQGWNVRKGEKGSRVEFWSLYDTKDKKKITQEEVKKIREQLTDAEFQERIKPVSSVYTVFNAEQIDGIPELDKIKIPFSAEELISQRDVLLKNMDVDFHEGGNRAFYRPSDDSITLPFAESFQDAYTYMSTLLHEAGHATGHESRLDRPVRNTFGSPAYAKEELRAEIASAFTGQALGIDGMGKEHLDNHKAYIQSWIETLENNPGELYAAIRDAEKISNYLIEKGEFDPDAKMQELGNGKEVLALSGKTKEAAERHQPHEKLYHISGQLAGRLIEDGRVNVYFKTNDPGGQEDVRRIGGLKKLYALDQGAVSLYVSETAFDQGKTLFPTVQCRLSESPAFEEGKIYTVSEFNSKMELEDRTYMEKKFDLLQKYKDYDGVAKAVVKDGLPGDSLAFLGYFKVDFMIRNGNRIIRDRQDIGDGDGSMLSFLEKNGYGAETMESLQKEMDTHTEFLSYQEKLHDVWNNLEQPFGIEEQPMHLQDNTFRMQGNQGMQGRGSIRGIKGVVPGGR